MSVEKPYNLLDIQSPHRQIHHRLGARVPQNSEGQAANQDGRNLVLGQESQDVLVAQTFTPVRG